MVSLTVSLWRETRIRDPTPPLDPSVGLCHPPPTGRPSRVPSPGGAFHGELLRGAGDLRRLLPGPFAAQHPPADRSAQPATLGPLRLRPRVERTSRLQRSGSGGPCSFSDLVGEWAGFGRFMCGGGERS